MKLALVALVVALVAGCATVNPYAYAEMDVCPAQMSDDDKRSGVVRCTAMCSSYGRDFAEYANDCKCWCAPGKAASGFTQHYPRNQM